MPTSVSRVVPGHDQWVPAEGVFQIKEFVLKYVLVVQVVGLFQLFEPSMLLRTIVLNIYVCYVFEEKVIKKKVRGKLV